MGTGVSRVPDLLLCLSPPYLKWSSTVHDTSFCLTPFLLPLLLGSPSGRQNLPFPSRWSTLPDLLPSPSGTSPSSSRFPCRCPPVPVPQGHGRVRFGSTIPKPKMIFTSPLASSRDSAPPQISAPPRSALEPDVLRLSPHELRTSPHRFSLRPPPLPTL